MNVMKTKKKYIAPKLREDAYMTELGFAASMLSVFDPTDEGNVDQEKWNDGGTLGGSGWDWN